MSLLVSVSDSVDRHLDVPFEYVGEYSSVKRIIFQVELAGFDERVLLAK